MLLHLLQYSRSLLFFKTRFVGSLSVLAFNKITKSQNNKITKSLNHKTTKPLNHKTTKQLNNKTTLSKIDYLSLRIVFSIEGESGIRESLLSDIGDRNRNPTRSLTHLYLLDIIVAVHENICLLDACFLI